MARTPDVVLDDDDLRAVVAFSLAAAGPVLPLVQAVTADPRPAEALQAARAFVDGEPRSRRQRLAAPAAHRAARELDRAAPGGAAAFHAAFHAAMAAGDAAASAYLHPLADAAQVGHLLRAAAHAELAWRAAGRPDEADAVADLAGPRLVGVLRRYPRAAGGRGEVATTMRRLDDRLRGREAS